MKEISLYLHIPFCIKRCSYCDFTTFTNNTNMVIEKYVNQICKELSSYKEDKLKLKTIFLGGGTPSVLKIDYLEKIFETINSTFDFDKSIETTIEINPVNLNRSNLKKYRLFGINRLSMGVQTFDENLLKSVNRDHSVQDIYKTYFSARESGFNNFSLDLIFGLPEQNEQMWENTLNKAMELKPEHISLYCLDLHDNTPLFEQVEHGIAKLPEETITLNMFEKAIKTLKENNFVHYEISNWAKEGYQAKHNISYWKNDEYIGVGISAASFYQQKRYTNTHDLGEYMKIQNFKRTAEKQTFKEELEETIFMNLRLLNEGLDIKKINSRFNFNILDYYKNEINELKSKNLLIHDDNILKLSDNAIFLSNEVFEKFIK